jgi:hypothetical protein
MVGLAEKGCLAWYQSRGLGFNSPCHAFSSAARNISHLPCCLLSTHIARAHSRDSHAGGEMLDYSISGPLAPSISPGFMVGLAEEGPLAAVGGGMLDYSIRGTLVSSISPEFYSWTG